MKTRIQNLPNLARLVGLVWLSTLNPQLSTAFAQGTALTYQGRLQDAAGPASGTYDFQFTVRDALTNGNAVGVNPLAAALAVSNGFFTAALDPGVGVFTGAERWLEIAVKTNGAALFTILSPRQKITAAPYAVTAGAVTGSVAAGQLTGTIPLAQLPAALVTNGASGVSLSGTFTGNGSNLTALNASQLASGTVPAAALSQAWKLGGNAGVTADAHFLGTTDDQPLEFKVDNQRGLRLEPTAYDDTVNVIGGSAANFVGAGNAGVTIGGGGAGDYFGFNYTNRVEADFGTVSGGAVNTILLNAQFATVGGGGGNLIQSNAYFATIPGGRNNSATEYAFAAGHRAKANHPGAFVWADATDADFASTGSNQFLVRAAGGVAIGTDDPAGALLRVAGAIKADAFLGAGTMFLLGTTDNQPLELTVNGTRALRLEPTGSNDTVNMIGGSARNFVGAGVVGGTIAGGGSGDYFGAAYTNRVEADFSTVSGGRQNAIWSNAYSATIGGGQNNSIRPGAYEATIGGGHLNTIETDASSATIAGGFQNTIQTNAISATIAGGNGNTIQSNAVASTIGGGIGNTIQDDSTAAAIGGGLVNLIQAAADRSFIGGGGRNVIVGSESFPVCGTIAGGLQNTIQTNTSYSTIGGGRENTIQTNAYSATIGGGYFNRVSSHYATVPGGAGNTAGGQFSFAAGHDAKALHDGTFVWSDSPGGGFTSTADNQFLIRAAGGVGINKATPATALDVNGTVTATSFSGNGTGLTGVDGGSLTGMIPDARLSVNVALRGGGNTFTGNQTIAGNVGIGTTTPATLIEIREATPTGPSLRLTGLGGFGSKVGIDLATYDPAAVGGSNVAARIEASDWNWSAGIDFQTKIPGERDHALVSRLFIQNDGNVGIGTTSPSAKLEVNGNVTANGINATAGTPLLLGTTDGQPLEFKVNNQRALRLEPTGNNSVNVIGGWMGNSVATGVVGGTVAGGGAGDYFGGAYTNRVEADFSTVSGGRQNTIWSNAYSATIGGGQNNSIRSGAYEATIGGGHLNTIETGASSATIGGGDGNTIQSSAYSATIGGGEGHWGVGEYATVGGGLQNSASNHSATVSGGRDNLSSGEAATVPGGRENLAAGAVSFAAGFRAKANHVGAFVWADASIAADLGSTAAHQFSTRASGGYRLFSNSEATAGVSLPAGGTAWAVISDRNVKKDLAPVDQRTILEKLAALPITQWRYQWESPDTTPHLGPMAQDFKAAFYPGTDDKTITTQEADGVALAAIQGLNEKVEVKSQNAEVSIQKLQAENAELKQRLEKLERLMNRENGGAR